MFSKILEIRNRSPIFCSAVINYGLIFVIMASKRKYLTLYMAKREGLSFPVTIVERKKKAFKKKINDLGEGRTHDLKINSLTP